MTDYIISGEIREMLITLQKELQQFGIDFYVVGAVARDIHLSRSPVFTSKRRTKDIDIAVMVSNEAQFYNIKQALISTTHFTAHSTEPIKLLYKNAIELDLLPFGDIENEHREARICHPRLFVMNMPGFIEVLSDIEEIQVSDGIRLKVCSLEGLVLLKLIAYGDNPQRTKDLLDIDHIIAAYFDLNDTAIYEEHAVLMDQYDPTNPAYLQLISARIIGSKINSLLRDSGALRDKVIYTLQKRRHETWQALVEGMANNEQ